jgi:hypothetical protein
VNEVTTMEGRGSTPSKTGVAFPLIQITGLSFMTKPMMALGCAKPVLRMVCTTLATE